MRNEFYKFFITFSNTPPAPFFFFEITKVLVVYFSLLQFCLDFFGNGVTVTDIQMHDVPFELLIHGRFHTMCLMPADMHISIVAFCGPDRLT